MLRKNAFIRRNWRSIFASITYVTDSLAVFSCGITAWYLLSQFYSGPVLSRNAALLVVASFWAILSFFVLIIGLYRQSYPANSRSQFLLATKSYVYAITFILVSFYFLHLVNIPRSYIILCLLLIPVYFLIGRGVIALLDEAFHGIGLGVHNALILANGTETGDTSYQFRNFPDLGYCIKGLVVNSKHSQTENGIFLGREIPVYTLPELDSFITQEDIDRIFIPSTSFVVNGFHEIVEKCKHHKVKLKVVSPEASSLLRVARVYDIAGITLYTPPRPRIEMGKRTLKRIFDIVGAATLLSLIHI